MQHALRAKKTFQIFFSQIKEGAAEKQLSDTSDASHSDQAAAVCAAGQANKDIFQAIIGVMSKKDRHPSILAEFLPGFQAQAARCLLDGLRSLFLLRHMQALRTKRNFPLPAEFTAPYFFLKRLFPSQSMLKMHGGERLF